MLHCRPQGRIFPGKMETQPRKKGITVQNLAHVLPETPEEEEDTLLGDQEDF